MRTRTAGITDPLDARVVEAYWIGNELLDQVSPTAVGTTMEGLFRRSVGPEFSNLAVGGVTNGLAHHSFDVFCIYPWVGLLGNERRQHQALGILDKCRIREAQIVEIVGGRITVESHPLTYDHRQLILGPTVREVTNGTVDGTAEVGDLAIGDWVAVHWDWICDRLAENQRDALRRYTAHHLTIVNDRIG